MISVFDLYELMPRTDCGKCSCGSCLKMAELIAAGKAQLRDCSVMAKPGNAFLEQAEEYIQNPD